MSVPSYWHGFDSRTVQVLFGNLIGNNSAVKRNFSVISVTNEFTTLLIQFHQVRNDEHLWCSGSIVSLQTTDKGSIPVRWKSYSIDRNFALIFVTKENTTLLFLFVHDGIEEHRWCSRNIAAFQAIDMGGVPVRRKITDRIRTFSVNHAPEGFKYIVLSTVRV